MQTSSGPVGPVGPVEGSVVALEPAAVAISCRPVRRTPLRLRCLYSLTVADWIGTDPPTRPVEDLVERGPDGEWKLVPCPTPGSIPDPKHNPGC